MVAEAVIEAPVKRKRVNNGHLGGRPKGSEAVYIPVSTRLRVRSLYVVQGLTPIVIGPKVNLTAEQVSNLVSREGWAQEKERVKQRITEEALARTKEQVEEVIDATAMLAEEGSVAGIQRALECTTKKSKFAAKDFASWAAGARQLVAIARQARGLEGGSEKGGDINVLYIACPRVGIEDAKQAALPSAAAKSEPINVTPIAASESPTDAQVASKA